ncbi:hypothetical protein [Nocardioides pantholopis]|uniref:hypothetical protein n=1 Tax=Nocardioides pantholopis TaxID=2483798 RepID=UPI000FDBFA47|nr:hypothetical protein [Nocardioides pantholopis]
MSSPAASPTSAARSRVPRIAGDAVERARLTVVPRARAARAARVPFVLLVSALLLGGVVGLLMFNTSMQQASFTATTLQERAANLQAREQELTAQLEELRNPQRLAVAARKQGMRTPPAPAFLHADGTVSGNPAPAAAQDGERVNPRPQGLPAALDPPARVVVVPAPAQPDLPSTDAGATGPGAAADSSADTGAGAAAGTAAEGRNGGRDTAARQARRSQR